MTTELKTYSFTDEDITLITFALRQLAKKTGMATIQNEATDLVGFIERQTAEKA
jgi:hypothetical protein